MNEYNLSQWVYDTLGMCGFFLVFLPLILGVFGFLIWLIIECIETEELRNDFVRQLDDHDKKVIQEYQLTTSFGRRRRLKRIRKNLLDNNKENK